MNKLTLGSIAAIVLAMIGSSPTAKADQYTEADLAFIQAVASVGYFQDEDLLIATGHQACADMDAGIYEGRTESYIARNTGDTRDLSDEYYASLFMNYAITYYCPRHADKAEHL